METSPPATVLILACHRPTARRWAAVLQQAGFGVWQAPDEVPEGVRPELVVTDRDPAEAGLAGPSAPDRVPPPEQAGVGVVRIGVPGDREEMGTGSEPPDARPGQSPPGEVPVPISSRSRGSADVYLPEDFTPRELRLACRLLAQIVRLRRRQQSGAELSRRLAREALTDPLTGLPNRRAWDQALAERLAAAPGHPGRLCVAIFDLDLFKRVNDAHGHPAGDEVLRAVGRALCEGLRQDDFVARLGGDEFGLLLWVSDRAAAARVVDRVRQALPGALTRIPTHAVTASAGYHVAGVKAAEQPSPLPSAGEGPGVRAVESQEAPSALPSPEDLFAAADAALRAAKQQGRDRTVGG